MDVTNDKSDRVKGRMGQGKGDYFDDEADCFRNSDIIYGARYLASRGRFRKSGKEQLSITLL